MRGCYLHDETPSPLEAEDYHLAQALEVLHEAGLI